jgi:hypothetical protein
MTSITSRSHQPFDVTFSLAIIRNYGNHIITSGGVGVEEREKRDYSSHLIGEYLMSMSLFPMNTPQFATSSLDVMLMLRDVTTTGRKPC